MNVYLSDLKLFKELSYRICDSKSEFLLVENSAWQVICDADAANQFQYDDRGFYITDQETYEWWKNYFAHQEELNERYDKINNLLNIADREELSRDFGDTQDADYDNHYSNGMAVLNEWELRSYNDYDNELTMKIFVDSMGDEWKNNLEAAKGYAEWLLKEKGIESELINSKGNVELIDSIGEPVENDMCDRFWQEFCESETAENYLKNELTKPKDFGMDF